jgi:hypothetical protein
MVLAMMILITTFEFKKCEMSEVTAKSGQENGRRDRKIFLYLSHHANGHVTN